MRILIVNKFLYPNGGSETYIFKVGSQLQNMGHEVQYFGMEHEGRIVGNEAEIYTKPVEFHGGSRISRLTMPFRILYSREAYQDIQKVLSVFHADIVHLNNINFQLTPSVIDAVKAFDPSIRIVYTAHDSQWVCPNHLMQIPSTGEACARCLDGDFSNCTRNRCIHNSRMRSALGELEARLYRVKKTYCKVDIVVCPSDFMNRTLSHNPQLAGRTVTMRNFVDMEASEEPGDANQITSWSDLTGSVPYVLYFGRYSREKGVATILEACRQLPDIPFLFAGAGDLESELGAVPNVHNVGFQTGSALTSLIKGAAFTVFPSECLENGPFTVIESIMNGTPIIASNLGGIPELIDENQTGELFEAGSAKELTEHIRNLYKDKKRLERYRENCLLTAQGKGTIQFCSLSEYCDKLVEKIYESIS